MVELLLLGQPDDLLDEIGLEGAADATVLHPHHRLLALDQVGVVDQALVDVELCHVVDDDGALELLVVMLGLKDVFEQGGLARAKEAAKESDRDQLVLRCCLHE